MGANLFMPKRGIDPFYKLHLEKVLLEKHFDFLQCRLDKNILHINGTCTPSEFSQTYNYKVKLQVRERPKVYVTNPVIKYNDEIHMYSTDNSLCLYYPRDYNWTSDSHLYNTIIPWTHEWFVFYELYQISGKWQHPFVEHRKI